MKKRGFLIDWVKDGQECFDKLEESDEGYYDLILMDIQMPILNGYDTTAKIRQIENPKKASTPIVAMTANAFEEDIAMAQKVGMNGFDCLGSSFSSLLLVFHVIVSDSCIFPHYHQELSHSINFIIFFTAFTTFDDKYIFCNFLLEYAHIGLFLVLSTNKSVKYLSQLTYFLLST